MDILRSAKDIDSFKLLKEKLIHIVCPATAGFTMLDAYANSFISKEAIYQFVENVNNRNEVGTLFPLAMITALPVPEWDNRDNKLDPSFYYNHLNDVLKLHNEHVKASKLLFIFNAYGNHFDKAIAIEQLEIILSKEEDKVWVDQVIIDEQ